MTGSAGQWAVFFDRDGVLTQATVRHGVPASPRSLVELRILPGAVDAVRRVQAVGALAIVVSNQPDVSRGLLSVAELNLMNARLREVLGVDDVFVCTHGGTEGCDCRKPKSGLLLEAAKIHRIDLARSWMIGDRWVDVAAGATAGVSTALLARPYSWKPTSTDEPPMGLQPTITCDDLGEAVGTISSRPRPAPSSS